MPFLTLAAIALVSWPGALAVSSSRNFGWAISISRRTRPGERSERVQPQLARCPFLRSAMRLLAVDRVGEHLRQADDVVVVDVADHDHLQE